MNRKTTPASLLLSLLLPTVVASPAHAALSIVLPGTVATAGWSDLTATRLAGYPGFMNATDPWPSPVAPNVPGSAATAAFDKLDGGGYPGSASIYDAGTPGTFTVFSDAPVAGLETLVFQIDMGASAFAAGPALRINGGPATLAPDFTTVVDGDFTFGFDGPVEPTENHAFQWDLSGVGESVTAFAVEWTTTPHTTIFGLTLDGGDTFAQVIPKPGTGLLALAGIGGLVLARRRRA